MFPRNLMTLILTLAVAFGTQVFAQADAVAKPGSILSASRSGGTRTHKGRQSSSKSSSSKSSKSSKKSKKSTGSTNRRVVRRRPSGTATHTTTTRTTRPATRTTRTTRTTHPTRTTRTVHHSRPSTHRTTHTVHHGRVRGQRVRRSYRSSHSSHHSAHYSSSHHHTTHSRSSARTGRTHGRSTTEPYVTGGLGISGFASDAIVDGALPGIGYNLAVGAKGKLFGGELGLNGGGYTFDPGSGSADIGLIGLSGDLKLQPSIDFFEPYVALGIGGYALQDGVIDETSAGVGVRLGAGADFRFDNIALRISYLYGAYGMGNDSDAYGGDFGAKTETLGASLLVYF